MSEPGGGHRAPARQQRRRVAAAEGDAHFADRHRAGGAEVIERAQRLALHVHPQIADEPWSTGLVPGHLSVGHVPDRLAGALLVQEEADEGTMALGLEHEATAALGRIPVPACVDARGVARCGRSLLAGRGTRRLRGTGQRLRPGRRRARVAPGVSTAAAGRQCQGQQGDQHGTHPIRAHRPACPRHRRAHHKASSPGALTVAGQDSRRSETATTWRACGSNA